jgi:cytochrome c peroxidase
MAMLAHTFGQQFRLGTPLGLDEYFPVSEDNPLTPQKIELGRRLFFDKLLSSDRSVACASCHKPELAFSDGLTVPIGVTNHRGTRNAPAIINRAYGKSFFWDGRAQTIEEQVLDPIQNPAEMNLPLDELIARLKAEPSYVDAFQQTFSDGISAANVSRALASFVRTLRSGNTSFDEFQNGNSAALSAEARRGLQLFRGKANCVACHVGPNFTDEQFHNTGVAWRDGQFTDAGRYAVTQQEKDRGAFKTPTLREVSRTAPYMHDGSLATLKEVIEYYDRGGNANPHLDAEIRPLHLTLEEKTYLLAFLNALNGSIAQIKTDRLRK